ncbi:ATP-binding cassette domain-containing protein [Gordonia sp. HY442]|uniref:ATP-binding cassette domain-containing protein n=1 Tax=Gordonia zhenghanii TaxID=2911516 RepID=UPI001F01F471|nr:ATP-binding cassette domain-containing protein [Gordonia zhenghanii]MCF8605109.1 ATP-binding cassette domain-containing protein [Gordonia zhenghanii]
MPDPAGSAADSGGRTPGRGRETDPLEDTVPWVPDDDPILRELRAWRNDLSSAPHDRAPADNASNGGANPAQRAVGSWSARDTGSGDTQAIDNRPPARSRSNEQIPDDSSPTRRFGRWRVDSDDRGSAPEGLNSGGAAKRSHQLPQDTRYAPTHVPRGPRHAAWDVMAPAPQAPAEAENLAPTEVPDEVEQPVPFVSEREQRLAAASTVAFEAISQADLEPEAGAEPAIVASHLRKTFGDFVAVDDVSFRVPKGTIVALLGPNGAGKTTTVNMLCTLLPPDKGRAVVAGHDVVENPAGVRTSIMLTGQFAALDESLTGRENLILFGRLLGLPKKKAVARADELLEDFSLVEAAGKRVGQYSGGMRRRIDIACGLVTSPEVVFLDEPTTGLDPRSRQDVWNLVDKLRDDGVTILLTTQYLEEADVLSDNIVVIDAGRVIAEGTSSELKAATGAAYCEVTPAHPAYLPRLRARLRDLIGDEAADDTNLDVLTVSVPAPNGPETLAEVMRRTEAAKIPLADIALRRPSLDEVFLSLTEKPKDDSKVTLVERDGDSLGDQVKSALPTRDGDQ